MKELPGNILPVKEVPFAHWQELPTCVRALEAAGVIFIAENGEGPGVRLRKPKE